MEEKGAGPGGWATVLDVSFLLEAFVSNGKKEHSDSEAISLAQ